MRRRPIELAAVATAAVPGLTPTAVSSAPDDPADFDSALLLDSEGKRWRVRSPRHAEASARLETEFMVLRAFAPAIRAELPFLMPTVAGTVRQGPLSTFVYSHLAGSTRSIEELSAGSAALAREIGAAMAAIHDLPHSLVSNADLPSYTPNEFRQRRLNELDQAATTGKIPPLLLRRWEHALEDVSLWRFNPCVVHGDLHEDNLLVDGDRVAAVTGWTDLRIGDPADDMAWLVASNEQDFVDAVLEHYTSSRRDSPDAHLLRRAALSAEFALAQYLVKGLAAGDQDMIGEAESMLTALAEDVAEHGGQPISVEPLPQPVAQPAEEVPAHAQPPQVQPSQAQPPHAPAQGQPAHAPAQGHGAPTARPEAESVPVPAVSKVTLLAPVSSPPAVPPGSATPAVQVAPIPLDEIRHEDNGAGDSEAGPAGSEAPAGATAVAAAGEGATPAPGTPEDTTGDAKAEAGSPASDAEAAPAGPVPGGATGDATDATRHQVAADGDAPVEDSTPAEDTLAADDTSTQSISVVGTSTSEGLSTTALPVVDAKSR